MELLRQHSDYALRLMLQLARLGEGESLSVRVLAGREEISYQFACKILQKLHRAGLVTSVMGTRGGYGLSRPACQITMAEVLAAMQGRPILNRCTQGIATCPRQGNCPVNKKLEHLQTVMDDYLSGVSLADLLSEEKSATVTTINMLSGTGDEYGRS